ncbi:retrotransposon protein, putative, ty1-copia subclass [Tanacetum coccineum]
MFEREKLSGSNFNDWFRSPKMVLRVEKKLFVIEQPISPAPPADSKYLRSGMRFMMLIMRLLVLCSEELKSMFEKQAGVERFDLIQTFHACKQEEGKPVGPYVIKMKNYVAQLERLGYVLPQDLSVGLILNGLTSDFVGFVRNYNMHNMGKTIGELHALLIEYEKGLPKKAATPQVMAIQGDYEISVSKNYVLYFNVIPSDGIYEIDMLNLVPNVNSIYSDCYFITFTDDYSRYGYVYLLKHKHEVFETFKLTPSYTPRHNDVSERRNHTLLDMVRSMMNLTTMSLSFWDYALETATRILNKRHHINYGYPKETMGYYFYFPPKNKTVVARYVEFLEKNLLSQEISGRAKNLKKFKIKIHHLLKTLVKFL